MTINKHARTRYFFSLWPPGTSKMLPSSPAINRRWVTQLFQEMLDHLWLWKKFSLFHIKILSLTGWNVLLCLLRCPMLHCGQELQTQPCWFTNLVDTTLNFLWTGSRTAEITLHSSQVFPTMIHFFLHLDETYYRVSRLFWVIHWLHFVIFFLSLFC